VGSELERFRGELQRLTTRSGRVEIPRGSGLNAQAKAIYDEVQARGAVVQGMSLLARGAHQVDNQLAVDMHRGVVETTEAIEETENQYTGSRYRVLIEEATDIFTAHNLAHNAAFYSAFGEQVVNQLERELSVPPPPHRRRFFLERR
jgi:hypothetical protein